MRLFASIGIILLVIVLQTYCQQGQNPTIGATAENLDLVSKSVTNLAKKISLAISSPKSKTELFSPVSIAGALSLLLLGSSGTTKTELMELMGFANQPISFTDIHKSFGRLFQELVSNEPSLEAKIPWRINDKCNNPDYDYEDDPQSKSQSNLGARGKRDVDSHFISVANGVFLDSNLQLNSHYEYLTKTLYKGEVSRKPLLSDPVQSSNDINRWVQQATRNKIPEIVSPEQVRNAPMVLVSALYFKAKWETMFIEPDTRPRPFYINGRESPPINISTMATSGCFPFYEDKQLDVKMVGLPYQEGKSTMYIIMPSQSNRHKIRTLQNRVNLGQMNEFIDRMVVKTGTVLLPKMKLENTLGLKGALISQGLQKVFDPYLSNLTEITRESRILENGNRGEHQTRATLTPIPITENQPSTRPIESKPRPTNPPTNNQDMHNTHRKGSATPVPMPVPGYPSSVKPLPPTLPTYPPNVLPTKGPFKVGLNEYDCYLINNCFYREHICNCYPYEQKQKDNRGCYNKPWIIHRTHGSCSPGSQVISHSDFEVCLDRSFYKYSTQRAQCRADCMEDRQTCYCCNPSAVVSEPTLPTTIPPPAVHYQPAQPIDIGNRINTDTFSNPRSTLRTPVCTTIYKCDFFRNCYEQKLCPLVNTNRRYKRQAPNNPSPPPNLYVGDVLHKVSLDINEQGTEGGAVTAVVIDRISSAFNLRMDGPFLIYLRNDVTKLPLFYGAVFDPRS